MAALSEVEICNIALAMIGEAPIRDLSEGSTSASICNTLYNHNRDWLLTTMDWTFSRFMEELSVTADDDAPDAYNDNNYVYKIPSGCLLPRTIAPRGKRVQWEVMGDYIITPASPAYLYYTRSITNTADMTTPFKNVLTSLLAWRLAPPLAQHRKITAEMKDGFGQALAEAMASDACTGSDYQHPDDDPQNMEFVNPDVSPYYGEIDDEY